MKSLRHFAIVTGKSDNVTGIYGPYPTREAAREALTADLQALADQGGEMPPSAGTFAADFEAIPIPAPAAKAASNEAT